MTAMRSRLSAPIDRVKEPVTDGEQVKRHEPIL